MPALASPTRSALSPLELLLKHDKPVPRYTSYPTASAFHSGVGARALLDELAVCSEAPLSLYVHVPFCRHACWYCGCHRITTQMGSKLVEPYLAALSTELKLLSEAMPRRRPVVQLHWGGGHTQLFESPGNCQPLALDRATLPPGCQSGGLDRGES